MPNNGKGEKAMLKRAKLIVTATKRAIALMKSLFVVISILSLTAGTVLVIVLGLASDMEPLNELVGFDLASLLVPFLGTFLCSTIIAFLLSRIALDRLLFRLAFSFVGTKEEQSGKIRQMKEAKILEVLGEQAKRIEEEIARRKEFEEGKIKLNLKASAKLQRRVYRAVEKEIHLLWEAVTLVQRFCPWMKKALDKRQKWENFLSNAN